MRPQKKLWQYALLCLTLLLLVACGDNSNNSSETGSIVFGVDWQGVPTISNNRSNMLAKPDATLLDCNAYDASTVEAIVYDPNGVFLTTGDQWNCDAHSGIIPNVKAGNNIKVELVVRNLAENILYCGEKTGVIVIPGETTDIGIITVTWCPKWSFLVWDQDVRGN